jgi:hypothetical protein
VKVQTHWKKAIDDDTNNADFQEVLDSNTANAKVRALFDVEFKKHFQGTLTVPLSSCSGPENT